MKITIDGRECACEKGEYLIDIAARNGIIIPRLCHLQGLPGLASCRICIVEADMGSYRQVVTSCVYPVEREITVYTNSEKIRKHRAMILALLCARAPENERTAAMLKYAGGAVPERFIRLKDEKCIVCGLCVNACESVGAGAISMVGRGTEKRVSMPYEERAETCVLCENCAAVCPTGCDAPNDYHPQDNTEG